MEKGLYYHSENGELFPITIKLSFMVVKGEQKVNAIFNLGDVHSEVPDGVIVEEFLKFLMCMQKSMGVDNCFVSFPEKTELLPFYIDCVKCGKRFLLEDVREGKIFCPNCGEITEVTKEDVSIWRKASKKEDESKL